MHQPPPRPRLVSTALLLCGLAMAHPAGAAPLVAAPSPPPTGLMAAWEALGIDALARAWSELQAAPRPGELGGPRRGLTWRTLLAFYDGRAAFQRTFTVEEGLGPQYNDVSCASCHRHPVLGGGGFDDSHNITIHGPPETDRDAMGLRKHSIAGFPAEKAAGRTATLRTPSLLGLGLLDAVPEAALDANADPEDRDGDGVRGRRSRRSGGGVEKPARFGQKANEWNLLRFSAGALFDEMGITNTVRRDPRRDDDKAPDPEAPRSYVMRLDAFVRHLARPPAAPVTSQITRGKALFASIGCATCHVPKLGEVRGAYTDMLLHDMGPSLDSGIKDGVAKGKHWRTAPLWGARYRRRFLHDDRAKTVPDALSHHQGEAQGAATRFRRLPEADRAAVVAFVRSR